jgi:hypothetical protein
MAYNDTQLDVIDQRVRAATERTTATGTLTSRSRSWWATTAYVTFDGSSVAVPVKMLGSAEVDEGDRVCLQKFGSEWVIVGGFTRRQPFKLFGSASYMASGNTTSTAWATFPFSTTFYLTKRFNETPLMATMHFGCFGQTGGPALAYGLRVTGPSGTPVDSEIGSFVFNTLGRHESLSMAATLPSVDAGEYVMQPVWRLKTAGAQVNVDASDQYSVEVQETGLA